MQINTKMKDTYQLIKIKVTVKIQAFKKLLCVGIELQIHLEKK